MLCDQTMKLLFGLFGFPGIAIGEESRGTLTVYSRKRVHFLAAILGSILIVSSAFLELQFGQSAKLPGLSEPQNAASV